MARRFERAGVTPEALAGLILAVETGTISNSLAKAVFEKMWATGRRAEEIVRGEGLARIDDEEALSALVREVLSANPKAVGQYRAGKTLVLGFFVGQVMKATRGQANPSLVTAIVERELQRA